MNFKDWFILNELRYKGFQRQFLASNPSLPRYVANQLYQNKLSPSLGNSIKLQINPIAQTVDFDPSGDQKHSTIDYKFNSKPRLSPSNLLSNTDYLKGIVWTKKPTVVKLSPLSFDDNTLHLFKLWRFGFSPKDYAVHNDTERFNIQRNQLLSQPEGENEPIVLIYDNGKYKLVEGYHRTMVRLLCAHDDTKGAPPEQIELLKSGNINKLDFNQWQPVLVKAYVGNKT